jgi:intracellular sulfur oxidation DsrE/DsrF family protein
MNVRRGVIPGLMAAILMMTLMPSDAAHLKDYPRKHRIVYQLDDGSLDFARWVVANNIRNHVTGVGGWKNIEAIELVVFGPALKLFVKDSIDPRLKQALDALQGQGMTFGACGNTMKGFAITADQLPDKSLILPQGGVVRIMELQEAGYTYIRP